MSKRDIETKEAELQSLTSRLDGVRASVAEKKAANARLRSEAATRDEARAQLAKLRETIRERRQLVEAERAEKAKLEAQVKEAMRVAGGERGAVKAISVAQGRLLEARASLAAVVTELGALEGDAAKKAALEAQGGDVPEDVVPPAPRAACVITSALDAEELWASCEAVGEVAGALRSACVSHSVVVALHSALTVRVGELREGLRQWGFAQGASARTAELTEALRADMQAGAQLAEEWAVEQAKLSAEHQDALSKLEQTKQRNATLLSKHELFCERVRTTRERSMKLEADSSEKLREIGETKERHAQLKYEYEQAAARLEVVKTALAEHPAEAERRVGAAEALAKRMQEEASRGLEELSQLQSQAACYQQAHGMLKQASAALDAQILSERAAQDALREEQERMSSELEAMARHYLAALPPLPGPDRPLSPAAPPPKRPLLSGSAPEGPHGPAGSLEAAARGAGTRPGASGATGRTHLSL
mmetsp:Transcript_44219/g.127785  ORF Transcript_44219/g.127785 Transcript_44219/m.127785 type:complete len:479 (+) Transcript_44219:45-1481(+)